MVLGGFRALPVIVAGDCVDLICCVLRSHRRCVFPSLCVSVDLTRCFSSYAYFVAGDCVDLIGCVLRFRLYFLSSRINIAYYCYRFFKLIQPFPSLIGWLFVDLQRGRATKLLVDGADPNRQTSACGVHPVQA